MTGMHKAQREYKQGIRFWLLPFLLAITLGCASEAHSSAQAFAGDAFIGLSSQRHHCCRIEAVNNGLHRADSENQLPCTCRSQYDEKLKTAVSPGSLRYHLCSKSVDHSN